MSDTGLKKCFVSNSLTNSGASYVVVSPPHWNNFEIVVELKEDFNWVVCRGVLGSPIKKSVSIIFGQGVWDKQNVLPVALQYIQCVRKTSYPVISSDLKEFLVAFLFALIAFDLRFPQQTKNHSDDLQYKHCPQNVISNILKKSSKWPKCTVPTRWINMGFFTHLHSPVFIVVLIQVWGRLIGRA